MPGHSTDDEDNDNTNNEQKPDDENNTPNKDKENNSGNITIDKDKNNSENITVVAKPSVSNTNSSSTITKTGDNNVAIPVLLGLLALGSLGLVVTLKKKKSA